MKYSLYLFFLFLPLGVQSQNSVKIGTYSSYHFTLIERITLSIFKHINYFTNGAEIKLNDNNYPKIINNIQILAIIY